MTEAHLRLAADIERRHLVIPFEHGGDGGLLIGAWRPAREASSLPPSRLKHATLYFVRNGVPGAFRLPVMRCGDPADLDVAAIYEHGISGAWKARPPRMPSSPPEGPRVGDPFVNLAWEHEVDGELVRSLARDAAAEESHGQVSSHGQGMAVCEALARLTRRVRGAAQAHFAARLDGRSAEVLAFMRERLPYFSWGAFGALTSDGDGSLRRYAERHPLLAGRALSSPLVAGKAAKGDLEGARDAAMDPRLVGAWVVDAVRFHPALSGCVDGRRRGTAVDAALLHLPTLPRQQVPTDPGSFADYVDASAWTDAVGGFDGGPTRRVRVSRMRGDWTGAIADCRLASVHRGEAVPLAMVTSLFFGMSHSFEYDLVETALKLEGGAEGPRRHFEWAVSKPRRVRAAEDIAYRGMNVPDRVRHAMRYAAAKPRIAAVGYCAPDYWRMYVPGAVPGDWIRVSPESEIRFVALASSASLNGRYQDLPRRERRWEDRVTLPATTPDGRIAVLFERRTADGSASLADRSYEVCMASAQRARTVLARTCGLPDDAGLGDALLARAGLLDEVRDSAARAVEERRSHLAAMQAAWGNALPRRLRRLEPEAFRAALVSEAKAGPMAA